MLISSRWIKTAVLSGLGVLFIFPSLVFARPFNFTDNGSFLERTVQPTGIQGDDVRTYAGDIIKNGLRLVGFLFFVLMFYGGYLWMTARGSEDQISKAKRVLIAAVIGLALIVAAYAVTAFIVGRAVSAGESSSIQGTPITPGP